MKMTQNWPWGSQIAVKKSTSPDMTKVFHTWPYGRFIYRATSEEANSIEQMKAPIFLEAV